MVGKNRKKFSFSLLFTFVIGILILLSFTDHVIAQNNNSKPSKIEKLSKTFLGITRHKFKSLCGNDGLGKAHCNAKVITLDDGITPLAGSVPSSTSFGPLQFHSAYQLPCQPGGSVSSACPVPASFGPQTIAIVIAYHSPNIENDLNVYSSYYRIPACTKANGCLKVINQNGGNSLPSNVNSGWTLEASLDVETAHSICQTCKILLVEANTNSYLDLSTAVNTAANLGATSISNSYGGSEGAFELNYDSYFNHPGIAVVASSGDGGYGVEYPAASPGVVGVGGTTLQLFTDYSYSSEAVWSGAGSGCSLYESANSWETGLSNWNQTGCGNQRGVSDISADSDPNTGAAVYDSTRYNNQTGWWQVGGTSLASPIIAAAFAMGGTLPNTGAASVLYANYNASNFHDIVSGSNGICSTIMCVAALGYDGPTGLGTPNGLGGFGGLPAATPTPTLSPTPSLTPAPTSTPTPTLTPTPIPPDSQPPTVSITSPTDGSTVRRSRTTAISASAADNVGVTKVEFYVNNSLLSTDTGSPYRANWDVPAGRNISYSLSAKAYDAANNSAISTVTVTSR